MTRKRNPRFPTGKLIKVEAIELTAGGRVKRVKIRDSELQKLKRANPTKRKRAKCKNTRRKHSKRLRSKRSKR